MPLNIGDKEAKEGMASAIYSTLETVLTSLLRESLENMPPTDPPTDIEKEIEDFDKKPWKRLSYAIADGVVRHFRRYDPPQDEEDEETNIIQPEYAEAFSSRVEDPEFWNWFAAFATVFKEWAADEAGDVITLKEALAEHFETESFEDIDDAENSIPTEMKGIIL